MLKPSLASGADMNSPHDWRSPLTQNRYCAPLSLTTSGSLAYAAGPSAKLTRCWVVNGPNGLFDVDIMISDDVCEPARLLSKMSGSYSRQVPLGPGTRSGAHRWLVPGVTKPFGWLVKILSSSKIDLLVCGAITRPSSVQFKPSVEKYPLVMFIGYGTASVLPD